MIQGDRNFSASIDENPQVLLENYVSPQKFIPYDKGFLKI
jgi:hypothetical protein